MTSIFTGTKKPDFGEYYITNGIIDPNEAINSIVTVTDTKVTFKTKYKNEQYQKKEFTDIKISSVSNYRYVIDKINMGNYLVYIGIDTIRKSVTTEYRDINGRIDQIYFSEKEGTMPPNFILSEPAPTTPTTTPAPTTTPVSKPTTPVSKPTTPEKSFLNKNLIYIVIVVLFLLAVGTGVFVFIRNRNRMISKNKLIV
jgi:hypothetical protein